MSSLFRLLAASVTVLCCVSCSTVSVPFPAQGAWRGQTAGSYSRFNQSCGAACSAPVAPGTGEILVPPASRAGLVLDKVVEAAKVIRGLITLERVLTSAELDRVEAIIKDCVAQAHADVNETFQHQKDGYTFANGKFPSDAECKKVIGVDEAGKDVSIARELGRLKHAAAFACIRNHLSKEFSGNFTIEPRYAPDPEGNGVFLSNGGPNTLHPDLVVHATRSATQVQCVYELKFPCLSIYKLDPRLSPGTEAQLRAYQELSKGCPVALISPEGLFQLLQ